MNSSKNPTSLRQILCHRNTNFEINLIHLKLHENSHDLTLVSRQRSFAEQSSVQILRAEGERGRRAAAHADDAASLLEAANQASQQPPIRLRSMDA